MVQWKRICLPMQKMVQPLVWEDPVEKEIVTHANILPWRTPWRGEPGGYSPWGRKELDMT